MTERDRDLISVETVAAHLAAESGLPAVWVEYDQLIFVKNEAQMRECPVVVPVSETTVRAAPSPDHFLICRRDFYVEGFEVGDIEDLPVAYTPEPGDS